MRNDIDIMRHQSVFNPHEHEYPVHIIGAGATGSRVFAALVELGVSQIHVYDYDVVESHNLANQIYGAKDVGQPKVTGCAAFAEHKLGTLPPSFQFHNLKVTAELLRTGGVAGGVVFLLTDTMDSRKEIVTGLLKRTNVSNQLAPPAPLVIIETRMASTHGNIYTVNPFDQAACKAWLSTLVDDTDPDSVEISPCGTALSVGTTASLIANYAVWQMINFFCNPIGLEAKIDVFFKPTLTLTSKSIA